MKVEITGNIAPISLQSTVEKVIDAWYDKLIADNPEMLQALQAVEDIRFSAITVDLQFKLSGTEEWQVITTDNHADIPELLTVKAELDDSGNIVGAVTDNDGNSNYSDFEALIAKGVPAELPTMESQYNQDDLKHIQSYSLDNYDAVISEDEAGQVVVQAFTGVEYSSLVAEAVFPAYELDNLKAHYRELEDAV